MPRYRVNYVGRSEVQPGMGPELGLPDHLGLPNFMSNRRTGLSETEFEDEIEAKSPPRALDEFFSQHAERREDVMVLGADGRSHAIEGVADYDPGTVYIWLEDGMMMEYQGIEEMTPGKAICPMCNGSGEIDEAVADDYDKIAGRKSNA